jgi:hypothetical protein
VSIEVEISNEEEVEISLGPLLLLLLTASIISDREEQSTGIPSFSMHLICVSSEFIDDMQLMLLLPVKLFSSKR